MTRILEKDIEDIIVGGLKTKGGIEFLRSKGLNIPEYDHSLIRRQFSLGSFGIADIIRISFLGNRIFVDVIELKAVPFDPDHLGQLGRYLTAVKRITGEILNIDPTPFKITFSGILITRGFTDVKDQMWLSEVLGDNIHVYTLGDDTNGDLKFEKRLPGYWEHINQNINCLPKSAIKGLKKIYQESYREHLKNKK